MPIVLAVAVWGRHWQYKSVLALCDNMAVVQVIIVLPSKDSTIMHLLRCLYYKLHYCSVPGKCPLLGKYPCNCFGCSNGKHPGNVSQDCSDDNADKNTFEDNGNVDDLNPFSDSDE